MPRGGERSGRPGGLYPQRSDMRSPKQYGDVKVQEAVTATPDAPAAAPEEFAGPAPGTITPLEAPSMRPEEPVTAGLDIGPGPGSEVLGPMVAPGNEALWDLRALLSQYPEYAKNLSRLIALAEDEV